MENFCWEWDVVRDMTAHMDTGAPLPRELFDKMLAAKNFQSGMQTVRQLEFSLFDLLLHMDFDPAHQHVMDLLAEVRREVAVLTPPEWHRFPNSFSHIFAGGYAAGYYSYKWAEVLSADAFAAFEESGRPKGSVLDAETGERFWNEILAVGGSRRRSNPSRPSAAANRRWMPSCATAAWSAPDPRSAAARRGGAQQPGETP
jgi:oligopeptidase A